MKFSRNTLILAALAIILILSLPFMKDFFTVGFSKDYFNTADFGNPQTINLEIFEESEFFSQFEFGITGIAKGTSGYERGPDPHQYQSPIDGHLTGTCNGCNYNFDCCCQKLGYEKFYSDSGWNVCVRTPTADITKVIITSGADTVLTRNSGDLLPMKIDIGEMVNRKCASAINYKKACLRGEVDCGVPPYEECFIPFTAKTEPMGTQVYYSFQYGRITPADSDNDAVNDILDLCPNTPPSSVVNSNGCSSSQIDSDGDSFVDSNDKCPSEPGLLEGCPIPVTVTDNQTTTEIIIGILTQNNTLSESQQNINELAVNDNNQLVLQSEGETLYSSIDTKLSETARNTQINKSSLVMGIIILLLILAFILIKLRKR